MKTIAIVGGGPSSYIPELSSDLASLWIGADHGAKVLIEKGMPVDVAVGDFDSVSGDMLALIQAKAQETKVYPQEKNETDLELAVNEAIDRQAERILFFGVTGGRMDHTLANIQLLYPLLQHGVEGRIIDNQNEMELKLAGSHTINYSTSYPYISFIPISLKVEGLTLHNFKYPLEKESVPIGSTLCLSNQLCEDTGTYFFKEGIVLVVRSRDEGDLK
ncbi:thiamine diphosphokinase [Salimicrobium halophilum]|uniref:Thiamine diphosphokinase n=1 Tax=Salimicrobium halophilum TaxID=86666 RepID=A0A1G8QDE9_9BACI|nr:thiamine diphosphokinase [Salimicrobium halophilum]SDJ02819.1 thiamine diphosphokinase [Salimicrobium halophilum]